MDTFAFGEFTIKVDCDVLQADGGTRTASITGGRVALADACAPGAARQSVPNPFGTLVAAVSVGICEGAGSTWPTSKIATPVSMPTWCCWNRTGSWNCRARRSMEAFHAASWMCCSVMRSVGIRELFGAQRKALGW
jgi:hypothetical protein